MWDYKEVGRFPGLEKKLTDLHRLSMRHNSIQYRLLKLSPSVTGAIRTPFDLEDVDSDLQGVTLEELLHFGADRIRKCTPVVAWDFSIIEKTEGILRW